MSNDPFGFPLNFLIFARDGRSFEDSVKEEARRLGLRHDEVLWSEPLKDRIRRLGVDDYILDIASKLQPGEDGVFGRFHAWEREV